MREFGRELVRRLKQKGEEFRYSAFVDEAGIAPSEARDVADSLFARFLVVVVDDGKLTEEDWKRLRKLADRLQLSDERRRQIEEQVGTHVLRKQQCDARVDGRITAEERSGFHQLKAALGLLQRAEAAEKNRERIFARIKESREYAARNDPERHARLPRYDSRSVTAGLGVFIFLLAASLFFVGMGLLLFIVAFTAAESGVEFMIEVFMGCGVLMGGGWFSYAIGVSLWYTYHRTRQLATAPVVSRPAIIFDKRRQIVRQVMKNRYGRDCGYRFHYFLYVTFQNEQGDRREYEFFQDRSGGYELQPDQKQGKNTDPYASLSIGDAGVLFLREVMVEGFEDIAVGFDRVIPGDDSLPNHFDEELEEFLNPKSLLTPRQSILDEKSERSRRTKTSIRN